jgi:transposase
LILTPGNTADCIMAQECVSLIPGIKELLADKGYDTDAFRAFLKQQKIRPVIPGKSNRKKPGTTGKPIRTAMSSSAASVGSRISGASPRVMTSSRKTSFLRCASSRSWPTGCELIESRP